MFIALPYLYIICSNLYLQIETAKILAVFPIPSISHQIVFRPLTRELAKRGHEVLVVTPDPAFSKGQTPDRFREIDVHDVSYNNWENFVSSATGNPDDLITQLEVAYDAIIKIFEKQTEAKEFKELLSNKSITFDVLLLEACARPALSLSYIYNVPVILVSSFGGLFESYEMFGSPNNPIFHPLPVRQKIYNLTTWEKITELYYNHYQLIQLYKNHEDKEDKVLTKIFGTDFPGLGKLKYNVHLMFLNIHPIWDNNRPVPPNIIYMGGLHQQPRKDLPSNLTSILDNSHEGVIYMSFGTNVDPSLLPAEKIKIILTVFSKLPYNVLWKWHSNISYPLPSNVKTMKWFPQADVLRHPKIKLFITQGGLQSTDEAITGGVPLIGIPMLGDQWFNVEKYVHHGIGVRLDLGTITEDNFMKAIKTVIEDDSYRRNIIRLRTLMKDQLNTPLERAVWWTEHVLRHGGAKHLRTPSANLSWSQYYEIEILIILLGSVCAILLACFILFLRVVKNMLNNAVSIKKIIKIESAKILAVFPTPSISHQVVFRPLTQELAKRGHEVVVITPDPAFPEGQTPERLREIDVHEISYSIWAKFILAVTENSNDLAAQLQAGYDLFIEIFEKQIEVEEVNELLSNTNTTFDLLLLESCSRPALSLSYVYNVPVILVSSLGASLGIYDIFGAPNYPTLYPLYLRQKIYNCSTWEKIVDLYNNHYRLTQICKNHEEKTDKVLTKRFGPNFPGLSKLKDNVHMVFLNIHPIWESNRPVPANIIHMGGLHQKPPKDLPCNLTTILNDSHNDVIYISFGTNVNPSLLSPEKIQIILNVFSKLPYNILWKWISNVTHNLPPNVKTMKWFPQADLLRHPKIKLFITQGGLQSTDEAITAGVPLIGIPILGDQWFNVEKYVYHGIGIRLDLETITEDKFLNSIKTVIENDSYRQNINRLRTSMQDQRQTPLERAVWWTEYVLRYGGTKHLRPTSVNSSWLQKYEIELLVVTLGSVCVAIVVYFVKMFFKIFDYITSNKKVKLK